MTVNGPTRLTELAKLPAAEKPVVSVDLNTRWTDESQRERVRIFLKNHLRAGADRRGPTTIRRGP